MLMIAAAAVVRVLIEYGLVVLVTAGAVVVVG